MKAKMRVSKPISRPHLNRSHLLPCNKLVKMSNMVLPFSQLSHAELTSLFDQVQVRSYQAGQSVFLPGDSASERLFILKQGRVDLYGMTPSGKRLVNAQILPGEIFGVRGMLGRTIQGNFAEAIEDSTVFIITRKQLLTYLRSQPDYLLHLLETACYALYVLEQRLAEAVYDPVPVRLARFLLNYVDPASGVLTNFTHEEIGNTIGAVRQTVTETLSFMRKRGLILTKPKQIQIIDWHGLEEMIHSWEN
jgi:CRP/FNR family cyclic AMP-dependent transcriptional regulator